MKVLFITRKYPPSVGGMQKISYGVISNFPELKNAEVISWGGSQKGLILFIPWAFLKSFYLLSFKKIDVIHLGDSALSFIGYIFKKIFQIPVTITAHGLDLTYKNRIYQAMIKRTLKEFDKVICVSAASKKKAIEKGVEESKCIIIHNGIDTSEWCLTKNKKDLRMDLEKNINLNNLRDKFLLLSAGRLVKRKGLYWFIKNVFQELDKDCVLLVVGRGEEEQRIRELTNRLGFKNRIFMLGKVSDEILKLLYNSCDVFIMPNIPIEGDMEGFGIVAIEAASCGLPVIASNLEGIKDAIKDGKNGFLVEPYNVEGYMNKINKIMNWEKVSEFKKNQIKYTRENYDLKNISLIYYDLFKKTIKR